MKQYIILLTLMSLAFTSCNKSKETSDKTNRGAEFNNQELIDWARKKVDSTMQANNIPAASIGIIEKGHLVLSEGFGVYNRNSTRQVSSNSLYQIASDTKKMTGIIANNLVAEKKLEFDKPITTYLGNTISEKAKRELRNITLRQLLLHTSGLPYRQLTMNRKDGEPMLIPYTEEELISDLNNVKLRSLPESEFGYSNFGYAVAGYICELASEKDYSELVDQYISQKYEMPNTTTQLSNEQLKNLVTPYKKDKRNEETKAFNMGKLSPVGGVYSNIEDISKLMLQQIKAYEEHSQDQESSNPLFLNEANINKENGYGYGLGKKSFRTGIQYGHGGDMDGFASAYIFSPTYKSGVAILTSSGGKWVGELEKELLYKLTDRKYIPPKKSIADEMYSKITSNGFELAIKWYNKHKTSNEYQLDEGEMNNVAYKLLKDSRMDDALEVFKLNAMLFPKSFNVFDSLGEAYLKAGNKDLAIKNYKKSVELNPKNENAIKVLKSLEN